MSNPWFRFYKEVLNDPKVQKLEGNVFKFWVNFLCVACDYEGKVPEETDLAFLMRLSETETKRFMERLHETNLLVHKDGYFIPKGWEVRQFKSDNSTERVKKHREKAKETADSNVVEMKQSETVSVTPPDTDTDTEQIQKESAETSSAGSGFEEFWKTWKSLKHSTTGDSKKRALAQWKRLKPPEREMAQSRALAYQRAFKAEYGPDCTLKHAERYLRDKCFEDVGPETPKAKAFEIFKGSEEYEAWYSHDQKLPYFEKGGSHDWYGQTRVLKPTKFPEQERKSA